MARLFYLHWNQAELAARVKPLVAAGHEVHGHWSTDDHMRWGDFVPEVMIISLDRLPSHGRHVAEWVWEAKKRQSIPILFAGGKPDKVAAAREQFSLARFCATEEVPAAVDELLRQPASR